MGYLILMLEKYLLESILEKVCGKKISRKRNWIHVLRNVYHKDLKQTLKELGIITFVLKMTIFVNL